MVNKRIRCTKEVFERRLKAAKNIAKRRKEEGRIESHKKRV